MLIVDVHTQRGLVALPPPLLKLLGAACALQGLARQYFQIPANPGGLRDIAMKPYPADGRSQHGSCGYRELWPCEL